MYAQILGTYKDDTDWIVINTIFDVDEKKNRLLFKKINDMVYPIVDDTNMPILLNTIEAQAFKSLPDSSFVKNFLSETLIHKISEKTSNIEKTWDPEDITIKNRFEHKNRVKGFGLQLNTILKAIKESGISYEFRTTVVNEYHCRDDFEKIGKMIEDASYYYLQQFVYRETVPHKMLTAPTPEAMREFLEIVSKYVKSASIRGL